MSKQLKMAAAAVLVSALAASASPGQSRDSTRAPVAVASAGDAAAVRAAETLRASDAILADVATIRRLGVLRPVASGLKSREAIRSMVLEELAETTTDREFSDSTAMLRFLGLVPESFELQRETVALLTEQVAGFYAPKTQYFFLADWIPLEQQRAIIAHELTHALTDQHFDLRKMGRRSKGNADARLASQALVEGDATAVMVQFSLLERGVAADLGALPISLTEMLRGGADGDADQPVFGSAPEVLRETLQFPYFYGAGFVQQMLKAGSWERVNRCYDAPPRSTEQVMHPEKYVAGEEPTPVRLPNVGSLLGSGWRRADDDVTGEFMCALMLRPSVGQTAAARSAAGWGGDRYAFYRNGATGACLYAQRSIWDSDADAEEFALAYSKRLDDRFTRTAGVPGVRGAWSGPAGVARLERRGKHVIVVEGTRDVPAEAVAARIWKSAS